MKTINFIVNFTMLKKPKYAKLPLRATLFVLLITLAIGNAWANNPSNYYASLEITQSGPTGAGSVYVANSNSKPETANPGTAVKSTATTSSGGSVTMYWWVDINPGYNVSLSGKVSGGPYSAASASGNVSCAASGSADGTQAYTATATFVAVTVNNVDAASKALAPTNPSIDYPFTVTFATSNLKTIALDLNKSPETADGKFTITSWTQDGNNVVATGKFNGGGSYGGASRNHSTTVSLQSKASGSTAKTCTVTANFPALAFVGVEATDVYATQGESGKTGSATFTYNYGAEDDFPTAPTLTPVSGTGALAITGYTVTPDFSAGTCTVTVDYTYDTNNGVGDTEATLTLTAANGDARSVTIAGHSEAMATNDASVTPAGGSPTEYATFAQALAAANGLTGATLTLLRNVDLGTIAATQTISKAMTLDLNGKTLQATVTSAIPLLTINATTTIKDGKSDGMIYNTGAINGVVYGVTVASGKTLTVLSGTVKAENTQQYFYGTASVGGTETNKTSVGARGIQQTATATVNIEGGTIQGLASRNAFGIREEGSKANNTTLNITGGTIYAEAASYAYGVYGLGKVNISDDAIITVQINTNTVNGNETYTNYRINTSKALDSYTLNGYGYGVHVTASPTNKATDCYFGTLNMTGGTINAYNANINMVGTTVQSQYMYGVYIGAGAAIKKSNTAPDGTLTQKATAIGQITGGTINVENDGQLAYGVIVCGSYNSFDNSESIFGISNTTVNVSAYSSAYGILSNASVGTSSSNYGGCYAGKIMLTNNNVTTTTTTSSTSVALYATGTMTTIKTATSATYAGEYEASGYMYVKSGTYTANSATSYATAAIAGPWTTSNAQRGAFKTYFAVDGSLGGNVESMSGIYISGGKFVANATTHARGVWNSGTTIITGGTFEANATTTNAYGIYSNRGVVQANGATLKAVAGTGTAYGVFSDAMINDYVGWKYAADYTLTNCNITATTTTGETAYGVYIYGTTRTISSVNSSYSSIGDVVLGGYAIVGNASVKGCAINATSAGAKAGGIYRVNTQVSADKLDICQGELTATGNTIIARTNGGATAYGIRSGGPSMITNNTITVTTSSTGSNGIIVGDGTATISGNTVTASGTGTVYGIQTYSAVNSTTGYLFQSNATLEDNTVTATTTSSNTAYAVYITTADGVNIASGTFAGDYVAAGSMVINSGKYTATAAGTTGYALVLDATKTKNAASGSATCTVNGGKFKGTASSAYADVNASAAVGNLVLAGGYYVTETNLTNYVADGYAVTALTSGEVYNEGYRRQISDNSGAVVCKVYQGSTLKKSCQSVEEALQYTQQNSSTTLVIVVVENCVLSAGDHILPSNATLFVPYKDGQTSIDTHATRYYGYTTPSPYKKLTFAAGAHLDAWGKIQAGGRQAAKNQMNGTNGCPHEKYGWIYLHEGSSITLESGAYLYAWGYVTGPGEIDAKRGSTVYESFQIRDWRGGSATTSWSGSNKGTNGAFPVTQYYIQNIESPIKFRPGAVEKCDGTVNAASNYRSFDDVKFIGTTNSGSFFEMEDEDMSEDTWVRKWYDAVNDKQVYEVNSSAKMNSITLSLYGYSFSSSDYVLPVTNNMKIHLLTGSLQITQNTELLPGAEIEVDKEATAYINSGKSLYVFDIDDWMTLNGTANVHTYPLPYSPSWKVPTTCPRGQKVTTDAALNIHGKFQVNGSLYTTAGGANIYSSNEDAGTITYGTNAPSSSGTVYVNVTTTASSKTAKTANPAWLKNEDTGEPWSYTSGTTSGKSWIYYNDKWNCWSENNCFGYDAQNHPYAKPKAYVQLTSDVADANHLYHDAETGNRAFIVEDGCMWWEVEPTPYDGNKYKCVDPDYDGRYKYYQYVNNKWQEAVVTITWMNGSTTLATYSNALYGVRPKYLNGNPTKSATSTEYYTWKGWNKGSAEGEFFAKDAELPIANENTTYYACFETHKYQYTITFKNSAADGGMVIDAPLVDAGERPVCRVTPTKTATAAETFEFSNWSGYAPGAELPVVTGSAEYTAVYTGTPRPYTITFQNFDGTVLQQSDVNYGTTPTYDGATPYRAKDAFYSYSFNEWSPAVTNVTGNATYTAQYNSTTRGYTIQFLNYDGTVLETKDVPRNQTPEYTGPAFSRPMNEAHIYTFNGWSPDLAEVTEDAAYTAQYIETARPYMITWLNDDNSQIDQTPVGYGITPTHAAATKAADASYVYTFAGWTPEPVSVTGEATYTATYTSVPTVASVSKEGETTTYYATIADAFEAANATTGATVTMLQDGSVTSEVEITAAMTIDLNGKTVSSTQAAATGVFKINASGKTVTITDSGSGGKIDHTASCGNNLYGVFLYAGSLNITGGTVSAKNNGSGRAYGLYTDGSATAVTMSRGTVEATSSSAFGIYSNSTSCTLTMTGGTFIGSGSSSRGIYVKSITTLSNATVTATGSASHAIFAKLGTMTINSGTYTATGTGAGYAIYFEDGTVTVNGGKFKGIAADIAKRNTAYNVILNGGYYVHETDLAAKCAENYHVFSASLTEGGITYNYEVAKGYTLSWATDGDALTGDYTSGTTKVGALITAPNMPTKTGYTFAGWSDGSSIVTPTTMPEANTAYTATWNCVSPTGLSITSTDNKWDFCNGDPMTLSVTGSNIASNAMYQWKKWNGSSWDNISDATSASYSTTMAAAKAGQYCCTVTNGSCSTTSAGVWVRVWQLHLGDDDIDFANTGTGTGSNTAVALNSDAHYEFKLKDNNGGWFGLNSKTIISTESDVALNGTGANVNLTSGLAGNYTFAINYSDKDNPKISVSYPTANQTAGYDIYFDKSVINDWTSESASDIYLRIGKSSHNKNNVTDNKNWSLVPGTDRFYTIKTLAYDGFEAWQIANNASWTGEGKSIYLVNTGDSYAITKATNFQKYVVDASGITIVPTTSNNTENGCNYWNVSTSTGMLTHTATITTPTNGTITISNAVQSLSATATTAGIPHRTILTITATPNSGYRCTSLTVNGETFTSGSTHILAADATIAATFESAETGDRLDIVDWTDDNVNGKTLTLNLNGIPASGWPYTINGIEYNKGDRAADRTLTISHNINEPDFELEIIVLDKNDNIYSKHNYIVPRVFNESATISGSHPSAIFYVRNGATLTINGETEVNAIYVSPEAELVVNSGKTLTVDTIILRTTPWKAASLENKGIINVTKTYYTRKDADNSGYFQFALPLASSIKGMHLSNYSNCTYGKSWILKSYNEASRAHNGVANNETTSNWTLLETNDDDDAVIAATTGYEMFSNSQYYREFYFPVTLPETPSTTVPVSHTDGVRDADEGWNAICSPLTSKFTQVFSDPSEGIKVSDLMEDGRYWQHVPTTIYPAVPFYYQAAANGSLDFSGSEIVVKAPRRAWNTSIPTQWLQLTINDEQGNKLDETNIYTHPEKFNASYQIGYDVAKQSLTGGKATIYTEWAYGKMAFAAVKDSIADTYIPVTVYASADKEYTFSMIENNYMTRLQYVLLFDTELGTVTDLLSGDYTCDLTQGTTAGRFYLQCVFAQESPSVTTGADSVSEESRKSLEKVQKIWYKNKVYIIYEGRVYDMTGRQCELQ